MIREVHGVGQETADRILLYALDKIRIKANEYFPKYKMNPDEREEHKKYWHHHHKLILQCLLIHLH